MYRIEQLSDSLCSSSCYKKILLLGLNHFFNTCMAQLIVIVQQVPSMENMSQSWMQRFPVKPCSFLTSPLYLLQLGLCLSLEHALRSLYTIRRSFEKKASPVKQDKSMAVLVLVLARQREMESGKSAHANADSSKRKSISLSIPIPIRVYQPCVYV